MTKSVALEPMGKRMHHPQCKYDNNKNRKKPLLTHDEWHMTICPYMDFAESSEYPIMWLNPNPDMDMIEEMRELETEGEAALGRGDYADMRLRTA